MGLVHRNWSDFHYLGCALRELANLNTLNLRVFNLSGQVIRFIPVDMTDGVLDVDKEYLFGGDDETISVTPDTTRG